MRHFDVALGGVGGHPAKVKYGGGVTGNVCTEDFVNLLETMGVDTGIDLDAMMQASKACEAVLGREFVQPCRAHRAQSVTTSVECDMNDVGIAGIAPAPPRAPSGRKAPLAIESAFCLEHGFELIEYGDGCAKISCEVLLRHLNRHGNAHSMAV